MALPSRRVSFPPECCVHGSRGRIRLHRELSPSILALSSIDRLTVTQAPPTLISSSPDSTILNGSGVNFTFDGGYYNPATTAEFNDVSHSLTEKNSRQLLVPLTSQDLTAAGLYSVREGIRFCRKRLRALT